MCQDKVPAYRRRYVYERNTYCPDHRFVSQHPSCDACRAQAKSKYKLSIYELGIDTDRGTLLDIAALLEFQVARKEITLTQARYQLVEYFPYTNCIVSTYSCPSVLELILPNYDTVREIPKVTLRNKGIQ